MSAAKDKLVYRAQDAMDAVGHPERLSLDELCRLVPILEGAAEREVGPPANSGNVITFAACRRRRARRVTSRAPVHWGPTNDPR